jgi:hypothetical protein
MVASLLPPSLNLQTPLVVNWLPGGVLHAAHSFWVVDFLPESDITWDSPSLKVAPIPLDAPVAILIDFVLVEVDLNVKVSAAAVPAKAQSRTAEVITSFMMHTPNTDSGAELRRYAR